MTLRDYAGIIRRNLLIILGTVLLGTALGYGWAVAQPKVYTATASAILKTGSSTSIGEALTSDNYAKSRVKSYLDIGQSRSVANSVIDSLNLNIAPDKLVNRVSVTNPVDTAVIRVSADGSTPEEAMNIAQAWIEGMAGLVDELENSPVTLPDGNTAIPDQAQSIVTLTTLDTATLPSSPSFPDIRIAVLVGGILGLLLGFALAAVRFYLDKRIHTPEQIEQQFNLPVIGVLPKLKSSGKRSTAKTDAAQQMSFGEAVRKLRTNLQFVNIDNPPRVFIVTSPSPGEGKSTVSRALARAIAESQTSVIAVDADLRLPTLTQGFNLIEGSGLTEILLKRAKVSEALQLAGGTGWLGVIGAGTLPPNPSEILGSQAMTSLIDSLAQEAIVILDTPPLLPVTDAAMLAASVDGVVVVVQAGKTTTEELAIALANLNRVGRAPLGIVLNQVKWRQSRNYSDYYGPQQGEVVPVTQPTTREEARAARTASDQ
ncbi:MAG: polysaccharide biosynthesis tyrosine autokinase [Microbacteriaceae bacterium]